MIFKEHARILLAKVPRMTVTFTSNVFCIYNVVFVVFCTDVLSNGVIKSVSRDLNISESEESKRYAVSRQLDANR